MPQERYPRFAVARLVIEMHDGDKMMLRVPDFPVRPPANPKPSDDDVPAVSRVARRILQTVGKMDQEEPTGEEIAASALPIPRSK